jgi:hypothetical protein
LSYKLYFACANTNTNTNTAILAILTDCLLPYQGAGGEIRGGANVAEPSNAETMDGRSNNSTVDALLSEIKHSMTTENSINEMAKKQDTPDGLMSRPQMHSTIGGDSVKDETKYQKLIAAEEHQIVDLENLNTRAMEVILRIQSKLAGRDFNKDISGGDELTVDEQVEKLIQEAVSVENLCELFVGWCPFW